MDPNTGPDPPQHPPINRNSLGLPYGYTTNFPTPPSRPLPAASQTLNLQTIPPQVFPGMLPAPTDLRPRLVNQDVALAELDVEYNLAQATNSANDGDVGGIEEEMGERNKKATAYEALERHIRERMPYVQLASQRLQAIMGERNDMPFDLPKTNNPRLPPFIPRSARVPDEAQVKTPKPPSVLGQSAFGRRGKSTGLLGKALLNLPTPIEVDPETGKGLREWLLSKGKQYGSVRKRELKSISLHDFTPNPNTNEFSNILLAHYSYGQNAERVDMYETDIPTTEIDPETGIERATVETWIWFFIAKCIVTISGNNITTRPIDPTTQDQDSPFSTPSSQYFTPASHTSTRPPTPLPPLQPPPNFPQPIPRSWVVFACPATHITHYDEVTESSLNPHPKSNFPFAPSHLTGKHIHKRKDFDFSHQGVPLFEFTAADELFAPGPDGRTPGNEFLSIDDIGPWYPDDAYEPYPEERYAEILEKWRATLGPEQLHDELEMSGDKWAPDPFTELPSPYQGAWWAGFYKALYDDCSRWKKIRKAMGRGKLRVVARWVEYEGPMTSMLGATKLGRDVQMGGASGIGSRAVERTLGRMRGGGGGGMSAVRRHDGPRRHGLMSETSIGLDSAGERALGRMRGGGGGGMSAVRRHDGPKRHDLMSEKSIGLDSAGERALGRMRGGGGGGMSAVRRHDGPRRHGLMSETSIGLDSAGERALGRMRGGGGGGMSAVRRHDGPKRHDLMSEKSIGLDSAGERALGRMRGGGGGGMSAVRRHDGPKRHDLTSETLKGLDGARFGLGKEKRSKK